MVRTRWSRLALRACLSLPQRIRNWNNIQGALGLAARRQVRLQAEFIPWHAEVLDERVLLTGPTANNDSYSVVHDHNLNPSTGVLANDTSGSGSGSGGSLTATLVTGPAHGSLTLNSNGTFSYTATTHFAGSDSFTYKAYDGTTYSNVATASISVTNTAPTVNSALYVIFKDTFNSVTEGANSVLTNDSDSDGDSLTASLVTGPSHGSLTLNSNGSFIYTPTANYFGTDSFVYAASDGITTTNGTASLTVTNPFSAQTNTPIQPFAGLVSLGAVSASQLTGEVQTDYGMVQGHDLAYASLTADVKPVIAVETTYNVVGLSTPDSVELHLTLGGITASTLYFNAPGLASPGTVHFAEQIDASSLATGHYQYQMTVISHYGSNTATRTFTGYQDIVNRQSGAFGPGWNLAELDSLSVGTGGVLWAGGKTGMGWFTDTGSGTYSSPAGPLAFTTLVKNGGGDYTLTDKFGNKENFSSAGLLTSKVDTNGNTTSYTYSSGKISTITDPFARTTTFNYTSGLVTSITDIAGKSTTLAYTSGKLTSITAPDPDGAGSLTAPVTTYAYDSSNRLTALTDPVSHATSLTYSFAGRVSQATLPDSTTNQFAPLDPVGLIDPAGGTGTSSNHATAYIVGVVASFTDALSLTTNSTFDRFGNLLSYTDALGFVTTYVRDANGLVTQITQPDPDGAGSLTAPVTAYQYDSKGNLTRITYADSSYETWTYSSTLNKPLTHTDQLGHTTTYTLDSHGNVLTITDPLSNVTTLAYNSLGLVTSVTGADPDGAGSLTSPVTSYTYDSDGRLTRMTNPDSTHKDFTYDSEDNLLTSTDELGHVTTFAYDNLNRLISVTLPDPDGAGSLTSPVTTYAYNAAGLLTSITDALGNVTSYAYNSRNWLTTVTAPDPDGAGSLTSPVTTYAYNANGWMTSQTDALGNVTSYVYDNDGRVTSVTAPDPDGAGSLAAPVTGYSYDNLGRVTRVTDPLSNHTDYAYNSLNQMTSMTDALGKVTAFTYNALGQVLTVTLPDPDGAGSLTSPVTTYTYTNDGQLATVTDPLGNVTSYAYDHDGRVTSVTQPDPDGAGSLTSPVTTYAYNSRNELTSVTDAMGYVTAYAYDNAGELTSVTQPDPDGAGSLTSPITSYSYDNDGRLTSVTDPLNHVTSYAYNADSQMTTVTDALSNVTTYAYDHDGRLTSVTQPDPDGAGSLTSPVTSYTYTADNQVASVTDPLGNVTSYGYDNDGRLTSVTQPDPDGAGSLTAPVTTYVYNAASELTSVTNALGYVTAYAYDADRRLTSVTLPDPDGAGSLTSPVTSYSYDNDGRLLVVTDPLSHTTQYAYNADSQVVTTTDALGNVTTGAYDHDGRLTSETLPDPDGAGSLTAPVTTYVYNADSQLTSVTNAASGVHSFSFDHDGRLTSETDEAGRTTSYAYDAASNTTSVTDNLGKITSYAYNADNELTSVTAPDPDGAGSLTSPVTTYGLDNLGRTITVTDPNSGVTHYAFDADGNLTSVQDPGGNTTGYVFDHLNRETSETDALSHTRSFSYDALGELTSKTDKDSRVTNYAYDHDGRVTAENWMSGGTSIYTASYVYNAASDLTSASDNYSAYAYAYNANDQVTSVDNSGTPNVPHVVLTVGYDNLGRETSLSATVAGMADFLNNYSYDSLDRETQVTQQGQTGGNTVAAKRVDLTYNADSQYATITRYANIAGTQLVATSTYGYDSDGRITSLAHAKGGTSLNSYTWGYDNTGRLTSSSSTDGTDSFAYDSSGQETGATHSYQTNESYSYDSNGNRTNTGYTTGTNNQLTSDGTYNYTYDNEGNLTRKTAISGGAYTTYTWDYHNRLTDVSNYTSANVLTSKVHYVYDVYDRLLGKQVDTNGDGTYDSAQRFVWSGNQIVLIFNGSSTMTDRLLPLPLGDGGGEGGALVDENAAGTVSWLLPDNLGTIRDVAQYNSGTNTTTVVDHLKYDSFGNITAQSNSANQPLFAFTSQMFDKDTGLQYNMARWYDPHDGRFISQDPSAFGSGDVDLYRYVNNSPMDFTDPTGLEEQATASGGGGQKPPTTPPPNVSDPSPDPPYVPGIPGIPGLGPLPRNSGSSKPPVSLPSPPPAPPSTRPKPNQMGPVGGGESGGGESGNELPAPWANPDPAEVPVIGPQPFKSKPPIVRVPIGSGGGEISAGIDPDDPKSIGIGGNKKVNLLPMRNWPWPFPNRPVRESPMKPPAPPRPGPPPGAPDPGFPFPPSVGPPPGAFPTDGPPAIGPPPGAP